MPSKSTSIPDERFDNLLANLAQQTGDINDLLDVFFGFLLRRTDFFTSGRDAKVCEDLVISHLKKFEVQAIQLVEEKRRAEAQKAEEKNRKLKAMTQAPEDMKHEEYQAYLRTQPEVEEVFDEQDEPVAKGKEVNGAVSPQADTDEDNDEADKPPVGNGGRTESYVWSQTLSSLDVYVPITPGTQAKDCSVSIGANHLKLGLKNCTPIIDGDFHSKIRPDISFWTLEDKKVIHLTLEKSDTMRWWSCVITGDAEIDTKKIVPENSKLSDLDSETRSTVEKMLFDQRQKASGLPSSDQLKQAEMLEKFKKAHPEMDFSNAKINWGGSDGGFGNF